MLTTIMPIPPIHTTVTFNLVWFLWMIGFVLAVFLPTIIWVIATRRIAQKQSQMKEAEQEYEEIPQFSYNKQPQVQQKKLKNVASRRLHEGMELSIDHFKQGKTFSLSDLSEKGKAEEEEAWTRFECSLPTTTRSFARACMVCWIR